VVVKEAECPALQGGVRNNLVQRFFEREVM
jgi:hypothetical protein